MSLGYSLIANRKLKAKLGPPDVYPQDPNQKEDDLSAVHVKQGFTTSYVNLSSNDEYGSALSKAAGLQPSKVWNSFKDILSKKEELNTLQEPKDKNKRQPINIRDDFWLVTGKTKSLCDKYFKELAGDKDLRLLAKRVPIFNKNEDILIKLVEFEVPSSRGVWLIKMHAAYKAAMQEANKSKHKRTTVDPCTEWTMALTRFINEQRVELQQIVNTNNNSPGTGLASLVEEVPPENSIAYKQMQYCWDLCYNMYGQGLLDRQEFLQAIVEIVEKTRDPEEPLFRLLMPQLLKYIGEFSQNELLARKLAFQCAKKITIMVMDTEAFIANGEPNNPINKDKVLMMPGTAEPMPPNFAGLLELQRDKEWCRIIIITLSSIMQQICMDCPTAMVWHYYSENKTPASLLGSPMDWLPDVRPYALCTPTRADTPEFRQKVKRAVMFADDRSRAVYEHWSSNGNEGSICSTYGTVGKILSVLEELDRFVFDRSDSSNCVDVLHTKLWGEASGQGVSAEDEAVVNILCQWAVTNNRSGEHRAFVAAKLLEQRQTDLLSPDTGEEKEEEEVYFTGPPVFQELLFKFLDTEAPYFKSAQASKKVRSEVANLILLFHELMAHDVFSHDAYLCSLISRSDLSNPLQRSGSSDSPNIDGISDGAGGQAGTPQGPGDVWRFSRHWQFTYQFPIPFSHEEGSSHDINQRHVLLYGSGRGKDETSKQVKKLTKEILKLFSKRFSVDVAEGGKIKKHHKSEFIFSEVVGKFQELSYFDQHAVTSQCGQTVIEMVQAFHGCSSAIHLPVIEHVSFLFDLAGQAFNIQYLLEWCTALLKELPLVESQLIERGSVLTRVYTTNLALYIVGVLKRYHAVLILSEDDVKSVWDSLVKISYRHSSVPQESPRHDSSGTRRPPPNLDCNSAEWCIMGYLHDLVISCPIIKTINDNAKDKYQVLRRLFNFSPEPSLSPYQVNDQFVEMFKIYIKDPKNRKVDPLIVRYLHEKPENQYSLVVSVLSSVINDQLDTETLNNLAILCCELTAQCSTLAQEWLGALFALCCANDSAYVDLLARVNLMDPIHDRLGVFVSILIARQCFSLQSFVVGVVTRSLVKAWNEGKGSPGHEAEAGARLSLHLLRKLFGTVESFQPCFYTIASPRAYPSNPLGIKLSCDRHLLAATHANISSGILVGAIIAVLKALLVLGHSASKGPRDVSTIALLTEEELSKLLLGDLATWTLNQICGQEWVRDRCLQVPDELLKQGILLDPFLKPQQAQSLLQLICHMQTPVSGKKHKDTSKTISHIIGELDEWSLRASMVDIKLMYHRLEDKKGEWVEEVSRCIVDSFQLGDNDDNDDDELNEDSDSDEPKPKKSKTDIGKKSKKQKYGPIWMVAHLVKHLKFLQPKILKVAAVVLEQGNWSRTAKVRVSSGHQPFLQLILTCLKENEFSDKDKMSREEREQEKEHLLQSLHTQLSTFLCFTNDEKLYNYEDPTARKTMQDALQLRFSLVGGLFESIYMNFQSITDWSTLLVQLVVRGVIDLTNNSDLYCMVIDMVAILIHSTLIIEKEVGGSDRAEENKRSYLGLVKKLKKEVGDKQNESIKYIRQLLPFPKQMEEVIVTEQFGMIPDSKGNKVRGFNCDKKQGLQVAEKQKVSPWDLLEGHKNPAPLSWNWFQAVKTERKPMRYEEAFQNMKYMKNTLQKPASYYLEDPPLPQEDLEPTKDSKEEEKNSDKNKQDSELQMQLAGGKRGPKGVRRGQTRDMSPLGRMGPMTPGPMTPGPSGMYGQPQNSNMGYMGNPGFSGPQPSSGPPMGQSQMNYNQSGMPFSGGQSGPPGVVPPGGTMPNVPGPRFGMPGASNSKVALQNMLRARHPGPGGGQYVSNPGGQMGMIRPGGGQYGGNMIPSGQNMGSMNRPMYPGGQMSNMNSGYGMQGQSYGGFGGSNPQMRMSTPGQAMGGMRPSGPGQYGMQQGSMNQGMGMSNMGMSRSGMMSGGPGPGYGMPSQSRQSGYGMQPGMGMSSSMGGPGMMGPQSMRPMGPGMMSGMQGGTGMPMQGQGGMGMQSGGMGMQGGGMGMGGMGQGGMQSGGMQGGSQLMAHLQRGNSMGGGGQGMGYQQNRF